MKPAFKLGSYAYCRHRIPGTNAITGTRVVVIQYTQSRVGVETRYMLKAWAMKKGAGRVINFD